MYLLGFGLVAALLGRGLAQEAHNSTSHGSNLNDDGTVKCIGTCAQGIFYQTAYGSASQAVTDTMVALNATEWCIAPDQKMWCPDLINTTVSNIAGKAATVLSIDINDCGDECILHGIERVNLWAAHDAMLWAYNIFSNTGTTVNETDVARLRSSLSQLERQIDQLDKAMGNVTQVPRVDPVPYLSTRVRGYASTTAAASLETARPTTVTRTTIATFTPPPPRPTSLFENPKYHGLPPQCQYEDTRPNWCNPLIECATLQQGDLDQSCRDTWKRYTEFCDYEQGQYCDIMYHGLKKRDTHNAFMYLPYECSIEDIMTHSGWPSSQDCKDQIWLAYRGPKLPPTKLLDWDRVSGGLPGECVKTWGDSYHTPRYCDPLNQCAELQNGRLELNKCDEIWRQWCSPRMMNACRIAFRGIQSPKTHDAFRWLPEECHIGKMLENPRNVPSECWRLIANADQPNEDW